MRANSKLFLEKLIYMESNNKKSAGISLCALKSFTCFFKFCLSLFGEKLLQWKFLVWVSEQTLEKTADPDSLRA
jgi:hypothetical protein